MRAIENPATFTRSFVDICCTVYEHMRLFCITLRSASVMFEGVLTNLDFWISCVGSQEAPDWIFKIRSNKLFIKEFINSLFAQDSVAVISSMSRLCLHSDPQPQGMLKDALQCASLAIIMENCARAGDMIGVVSGCCSITDIVSSNAENAAKLVSKVISSLGIDDEDGTNRIPFIVDALFEVAVTFNSAAARSPAHSISYAREFCEQVAQSCGQIFAPLLTGMDGIESQIEICTQKLRKAASCDVVPNMHETAEKWAEANQSQIVEAICSPLPQLNEYLWTTEAFSQAWTGLKVLSFLCASTDSEVMSVIWLSAQLLVAGPSAASSCPEFLKVFQRFSSGSRNFNFAAAGTGAIPLPDVILKSAEFCQKLCQTFSSECSVVDRAQGISDFTSYIVSNPTLLTVSSSFLHLRAIKSLFAGSFGSVLRFFQNVGHVSVLRLSLLLETKQFLECIYLLKHYQACCLNLNGSDEADVAFIVDFCVAGLVAFASKTLPSLSSPSGAQLVYTACSCSSINRSVPLRDFSKVLHAAVSAQDVPENDAELAVAIFNSVHGCFGKTFSVDVESYAASVGLFLERCSQFLSASTSAAAEQFAPLVVKLITLISPVLTKNPKLLGPLLTRLFCIFKMFGLIDIFAGSVSTLEANKVLKSQVNSFSLEISNATFNWTTIRSRLLDVLNVILASDATVAAHCCLVLAATISFSLRMKQLRQQNSNNSSGVQLLVANLFTVGCSGVGDSGDILHSICNTSKRIPLPFLSLITHVSCSSHSERRGGDGCNLCPDSGRS